MAVKELDVNVRYGTPREFIGLSSDTKPTEDVPAGSTFMELDGAQDVYLFSGEAWIKLM